MNFNSGFSQSLQCRPGAGWIFGILIIFCSVGSTKCFSQKTVKFNQIDPELYTTESLKDFLTTTESPKLVVRYSDIKHNQSDLEINYLYNIIEREFLKGGVEVRDRALFDEILNRSEDFNDYSVISEKTDTDIILELIRIDTDIEYETEVYYTKKGVEKELYNEIASAKGASVEFKLILVKTNEFAGSYKFFYTPCAEGCHIILKDNAVVFLNSEGGKDKDGRETIDLSDFEKFIQTACQELIIHLDSIKIVRNE